MKRKYNTNDVFSTNKQKNLKENMEPKEEEVALEKIQNPKWYQKIITYIKKLLFK